jgi:GT2 family glycosyltransferase
MAGPGISVVIPRWNGRGLLEKCLPTVRAALDFRGVESEVIVVDDAGTDGTAEYISEKFPWARYERMPVRRGFVHTANQGVRLARNELVCLLNNDMRIEPDFFPPLAEHFKDPRVFAVSARALQADTGALNIGRRVRRLENYEMKGVGEDLDDPDAGFTFYASGGASLFRKSMADEIGLLDEMYAPYYLEDTDISYRAWKRGYLVIYEPRAMAHHIGSASITKKGAAPHVRFAKRLRASAIINRNVILFYIKNFTDPPVWAACKRMIIRRTLISVPALKVTWLLGAAMSLPRIGRAVSARAVEKREAKLSDRQVFERLNSRYGLEMGEDGKAGE